MQRQRHSAGCWLCCSLLLLLLAVTAAASPTASTRRQRQRRPALLSRNKLRRHASATDNTVTEDHAAVSFLFEDLSSSHGTTTARDTLSLPATRVRQLAEPFVNVVRNNGNDDAMVIDFPQLMSACHNFAQAMVDVGQSLSARDMRKNIAKAERFYASSSFASHNNIQSMRDILQHEQQTGVHTYDDHATGAQLVRLGEESCAMGLLWIRRSLDFQCLMFQQLIKGLDPDAAAQFAYENTLREYHGRILQKLYAVGLKSSSGSNKAWLAQIGGYDKDSMSREQCEATKRDLNFLVGVWTPLLAQWENIYRELNVDEKRRV